MKKIFGFASVFALAAGFSLSSCSSDDVAEEALNPSYNGQSVKTQFSISIPHGQKNSRMTTEETQSDAAFQGMKDIKVLTLKQNQRVEGATVPSGSFNLFPIAKSGDLANNDSKAKIYNDVSIDVDVNRMLFYGSSAAETEGKLTTNLYKMQKQALQDIEFNLVPRSSQALSNSTEGKAILEYLNGLAIVENFNMEQVGSTANPFYPFYNNLKGLKIASASHLKTFIQLMYSGVEAAKVLDNGDKTTLDNLRTALKEAIVGDGKLFKTETNDAQGFAVLEWNETTPNIATIQQFPGNLNLPDGIASVTFSEGSSKFSFANQSLGESLTLDPKNITWPASLQYFSNSDLAVSDETYSDQLIANTSWAELIEQVYSGATTNNGIVTAATRSIAMVKPINYGVARLETAVRIGNGEIVDSKGFPVINNTDGYTVTGILIGGQKRVGWNFEQKESDDAWTIYDGNWQGDKALFGNFNSANYNSTLTLESAHGSGAHNALIAEDAVYIAVEFVNDGNDFYGNSQQIVKHGTKFYLTAKLNPVENATANKATKVLQQDYVTKASLTINKLSNAYVTIPDLRPSKMEFGMSVNLEWTKGFEFEQEFE